MEESAENAQPHAATPLSLRNQLAASAMQALITAAWSNPTPARTAHREWANGQPPGEAVDFGRWLAESAYGYADDMLRAGQA